MVLPSQGYEVAHEAAEAAQHQILAEKPETEFVKKVSGNESAEAGI